MTTDVYENCTVSCSKNRAEIKRLVTTLVSKCKTFQTTWSEEHGWIVFIFEDNERRGLIGQWVDG